MTDDRLPSDTPDELLSAYLLGDLPAAEAQAFEASLAHNPQLAARLDALADALVALGGHDDAVPPAGFDARLDERLRQARDGAPVVALDQARERRTRSRGWWTAVGTAAAVVAVGGVMAANSLRGVAGGGADLATGGDDTTAAMDSAEGGGEMALEESAASADGAPDAADTDRTTAGAVPAPPTAPVINDDQAVIDDEAALRDRYTSAPEVTGLLGLPVDEASAVAASFTAAVRDAEPFGGDGAPGDCLDTITAQADQPLVPARVETVRYAGQPAVAYVLVTASPQATVLDRVEAWVVTPDGCATLVFQQS